MKALHFSIILLFMSTITHSQKKDPWMEYMMPNEVHALLNEYVGEFDLEITMWMKEGGEPMVMNVISDHKMILDNRFLEMTQFGKMMGMDYQSLSTLGFNTINKTFSLTALTNMGTGTLYLNGAWNQEKRIANLNGQITNPMDGKTIAVRQQITFSNENQLLIENFDTYEGGKEKKSIQYKYVRK